MIPLIVDGHEAKARSGHPEREARKSNVEKGPCVRAASTDLEACAQPQNLWLPEHLGQLLPPGLITHVTNSLHRPLVLPKLAYGR